MTPSAPTPWHVTLPPASGPAYRIETDRLVLRCWEPKDAPMLSAAVLASVEHLRPWMPWATDAHDVDSVYHRLRKFRSDFDSGANFIYGVFDRAEGEVLGGTGLHARVGPKALEIGYWIASEHINQGFATELSAALTRVAFEVHRVNRVDIHHDPLNVRSGSVPKKLGYRFEATLRSRLINAEGKHPDSNIWTMLREEYEASRVRAVKVKALDGMGRAMIECCCE